MENVFWQAVHVMGNGIRTSGYTDQPAAPQIWAIHGGRERASVSGGTNFQRFDSGLACARPVSATVRGVMNGFEQGRVAARRDWAPGLITLTIDAAIEPFNAGQFVNLGLELDGQFVRRSYSIASAPGAPLEFYLKEVPGGALTPQLTRLEAGASVWVERKPQGFFTLAYVPPCRELWLVATGTGLGPFLAMLRGADVWQRFERVSVVHGARSATHLSYAEELAALGAKHAGRLSYTQLVSQGPPGTALPGRVTTAFADGSLEARADLKLDPDRSHLLLCGNPDMILEVTAVLALRGLRKHRVRTPGHITSEKYW